MNKINCNYFYFTLTFF